MKSNWFDPHSSFLSLRIVWITVAILFFLSGTSSAFIIHYSNLQWDLSSTGFNIFISEFRFPLGIAALIIPIIALLAANHRSEQTKEQIRVTSSQNVFSNYYKHIEEFTKYLNGRIESDADIRYAHANIYPNASSGDYEINPDIFNLISKLDELADFLLANYTSEHNEIADKAMFDEFEWVIYRLYLFIYKKPYDYIYNIPSEHYGEFNKTYLFISKELIVSAIKAIEKIEVVCEFSIDFDYNAKSLYILSKNIDSIYVSIDSAGKSIRNSRSNKDREEQTFEQANEAFYALLQKASSADD